MKPIQRIESSQVTDAQENKRLADRIIVLEDELIMVRSGVFFGCVCSPEYRYSTNFEKMGFSGPPDHRLVGDRGQAPGRSLFSLFFS